MSRTAFGMQRNSDNWWWQGGDEWTPNECAARAFRMRHDAVMAFVLDRHGPPVPARPARLIGRQYSRKQQRTA